MKWLRRHTERAIDLVFAEARRRLAMRQGSPAQADRVPSDGQLSATGSYVLSDEDLLEHGAIYSHVAAA